MIPFLWNFQDKQTYRDFKKSSGCQALGGGRKGVTVNEYSFFLNDENILKLTVMDIQLCKYTKSH